VQFHPEVDPATVALWCDEARRTGRMSAGAVARLQMDTAANAEGSRRRGTRLFGRFLERSGWAVG